ncbi:hypothetical protein HMI56_006549 [Coelomomyces lativittatus]|nr:hypothetical protein HMI56_006549 [Coelomomyces lativittatus]
MSENTNTIPERPKSRGSPKSSGTYSSVSGLYNSLNGTSLASPLNMSHKAHEFSTLAFQHNMEREKSSSIECAPVPKTSKSSQSLNNNHIDLITPPVPPSSPVLEDSKGEPQFTSSGSVRDRRTSLPEYDLNTFNPQKKFQAVETPVQIHKHGRPKGNMFRISTNQAHFISPPSNGMPLLQLSPNINEHINPISSNFLSFQEKQNTDGAVAPYHGSNSNITSSVNHLQILQSPHIPPIPDVPSLTANVFDDSNALPDQNEAKNETTTSNFMTAAARAQYLSPENSLQSTLLKQSLNSSARSQYTSNTLNSFERPYFNKKKLETELSTPVILEKMNSSSSQLLGDKNTTIRKVGKEKFINGPLTQGIIEPIQQIPVSNPSKAKEFTSPTKYQKSRKAFFCILLLFAISAFIIALFPFLHLNSILSSLQNTEKETSKLLGAIEFTSNGTATFNGTVNSNNIEDKSIISSKLGDMAVKGVNIDNSTITNRMIQDGTITASKLNFSISGGTALQDSSINSNHISNYAVTHNKLAPDAVDSSNIQVIDF